MILNSEEFKGMALLNEAFYGKPAEFKEIEKNLAKVIDMIYLTIKDPKKAININDMPEVKNIERLFTNFFGVKETIISFYSSIQVYDKMLMASGAMTFPSSISYFKKKDSNNNKLRDKKDLVIGGMFDILYVYNTKANAEELMALILHEIGHCFDASIFTFLSNFVVSVDRSDRYRIKKDSQSLSFVFGKKSIMSSISGTAMQFILRNVLILKTFNEINKFLLKFPVLSKYIMIITKLSTSARYIINALHPVRSIIQNALSPTLLLMKALNPRNLFGYNMEKFADSFATSYGYGVPLSTLYSKLNASTYLILNDKIEKIPGLNVGMDFLDTCSKVSTLFMFDPHPAQCNTILMQLNKLKRDLKDPKLDPRVKKDLIENIEELEDFINNVYLNIKEDANKGKFFSIIWKFIMVKIFRGKLDPRELFELAWKSEL